jgi:hypothetical protein
MMFTIPANINAFFDDLKPRRTRSMVRMRNRSIAAFLGFPETVVEKFFGPEACEPGRSARK